jgi:hypothetical protein
MPYKAEQREGKWVVVNTDTDEVKATHESEEDAKGQVRLLHMLERERDAS